DHGQLPELQGLQGGTHRRGHTRAAGELDLEAAADVAADDQEIELGPAVQLPEVAFLGPGVEMRRDLADGEAFPGGASLRMAEQVLARAQTEQGVQDAAVREVDLRRLHLALGDVLVPRLDTARHEGGAEGVEIAAHGLVGDPEGAGELRAVPDLAVVV